MKKKIVIVFHICYWLLTIPAIPYMFSMSYFMLSLCLFRDKLTNQNGEIRFDNYLPYTLLFAFIGACIFYASYYSLSYIIKRPIRMIWVIMFYVVTCLVISLPADYISYQAASELGPILYFNLSGFLLRACLEWYQDRKRNKELEAFAKARHLELLKSKIEPHFLFNNLNNIDVLIEEDAKRASDYLKKLSDLLRFMLYEADAQSVSLKKEIDYIMKYIELQKLRTTNNNYVSFKVYGPVEGKKVYPMIFIHFIENAFKFAGNKKIDGAVEISLEIDDTHLHFKCKNHISVDKEVYSEKDGMGMKLLNQKLDLLYRKEYILKVNKENNWYLVTLDIPFSEN